MQRVLIVIPVRMESTRLPNKPLQRLGGRTVIGAVIERLHSLAIPNVVDICVATDSAKVAATVNHMVPTYMTSPDCRNGTERVAEAMRGNEYKDIDVVVNVQGDQPFIRTQEVHGAVLQLNNDKVNVGTAVLNLKDGEDTNVHTVKALVHNDGMVSVFARVMASQKTFACPATCTHVGVYAYRPDTLQRWARSPVCALESMSGLEQARAMQLGMRFGASWVQEELLFDEQRPFSIDTPEDLIRAQQRVERDARQDS